MLGVTQGGTGEAIWWFDPEIDWWIKRERIEREMDQALGIVRTLEAVTIEVPER
jgi:hypothetical protein